MTRRTATNRTAAIELVAFARRARELGGAEVGIAVRARPRTGDTAVSIAIVTPLGERRVRRLVFLTGPMGRSRSAPPLPRSCSRPCATRTRPTDAARARARGRQEMVRTG